MIDQHYKGALCNDANEVAYLRISVPLYLQPIAFFLFSIFTSFILIRVAPFYYFSAAS